ncbi:Spo0E family sporulation regulatory protein-aspartic acid phosphatase [Alkalihalobacillus sp. 1P02AB]|uniref:Spo0E family sporulation regulatory protein-aspartic acid phosphatase n=1 Tax=Alkalihalobacillus sp. 1P02AB TaxID=3132260 RepID=UPI0039A57204
MSKMLTYDACVERIEQLREKMIVTAAQKGMHDPLVLQYSQELDRAHNYILFLQSLNIDSLSKT